MESYLRQIADETANLFVANKSPTTSGAPSSYTNDDIMFAAAIDDDDIHDNAEEFQSEASDSIASFAEWFFSDDDHHDEDGGASPSPTNIGNCCSPIGERDNGTAIRTTKRRPTKQLENPQYTEFIQCAKSSIDIVSYILDPLGDMLRGTKFCVKTWDYERRYHPMAHRDEMKKTPSPEINHFSKDLSLESNNECNTTFTTSTSTKSSSLDTSTASTSLMVVDMTTGHAIENSMDISDELDHGRLGIAPMITYSNNLNNDDDGGDLVRKLFASGEDEFVVSFDTNVYRGKCNEQQYSKTLSQMLIETNYLFSLTQDAPQSHYNLEEDRIALSLETRTNDEVRTAPSPDPHAIYCRPPRQRLRQEERNFRKTLYSTSDPHAIYCCQPRVRIRHEKTHDNIKESTDNTAANDDNRVLRGQPTATSVASTNAPTLPTTTTTTSTSSTTTIYTMTGRWSGDKLKRAKLKRRAKMEKARLITP